MLTTDLYAEVTHVGGVHHGRHHVQAVGGAGAGVAAPVARVSSVQTGRGTHGAHHGSALGLRRQHHGGLDDGDTVGGGSVADGSVGQPPRILSLLVLRSVVSLGLDKINKM